MMFAVIYIPNFALQAVLRHAPELHSRPVILIDGAEKKAAVFQMTRAAREAGICPGQSCPQALARCGETMVKSRAPEQERAVAEILLQTAYRFSPRLEATLDGVCTLDLNGLSVNPGVGRMPPLEFARAQTQWSKNILEAFAAVHLQVQVGMASTPLLALHAARHAAPFLFVENAVQFVSSLPIECLDPAPEILAVLHRWGIRTAGAFLALGKQNVLERFGREALELFERAAADEIRPLKMVVPPETYAESAEFEIEIESLQPLLFILRRFVEHLAKRLDIFSLVIAELHLDLRLSDGRQYQHHFRIPSPTGNVDVLFRMLHTHLEGVRTDSPIVALRLSAQPCRGNTHQFGLFESTLRDPNQFAETLARLGALCGTDRVGTPVLEESHRPDAFKMESPRFDSPPTADQSPAAGSRSLTGPRLRRFRPAFHADVETKDEQPRFISTLKFNSPIDQCQGPWKTSGNWWQPDKLWRREEWDIQTQDGSLYRIYHENEDWFVEGVYD